MTDTKNSLFEGACPDRIAELDTFTDTGMASEDFLAHLDACPACQAAADRVMRLEAEALEEFAREFRKADGGDRNSSPKSRISRLIDRLFKIFFGCWVAAVLLTAVAMALMVYGDKRDKKIARETREKVEVLFPGALDRYCGADPEYLCHFGHEQAACVNPYRYMFLPFPAPTKVLCEFDSWPKPHPKYGAAFFIVEGSEVVGYRYPNCRNSETKAVVTLEGGQPQVRRFPDEGTAADECDAGPRIEVGRWSLYQAAGLFG